MSQATCDMPVRYLSILSRGIHDYRQYDLKYECQNKVDLLHRQVVGSSGPGVAQRFVAAGRAGVKLRSFADHYAAGLALARAIPFQRPHLWIRGRIFRARRVRESLNHANSFIVLALLNEGTVIGG